MRKRISFMDRAVAGEVPHLDRALDRAISAWNRKGEHTQSLREWLGMTNGEYHGWVHESETIRMIVKARRDQHRLHRLSEAVLAHEAAEKRVADLKNDRGHFRCSVEYGSKFAPTSPGSPFSILTAVRRHSQLPCWKSRGYDQDGEPKGPIAETRWCDSCKKRQKVYERYLVAVQERATALRTARYWAKKTYKPFGEETLTEGGES